MSTNDIFMFVLVGITFVVSVVAGFWLAGRLTPEQTDFFGQRKKYVKINFASCLSFIIFAILVAIMINIWG